MTKFYFRQPNTMIMVDLSGKVIDGADPIWREVMTPLNFAFDKLPDYTIENVVKILSAQVIESDSIAKAQASTAAYLNTQLLKYQNNWLIKLLNYFGLI